MTETELMTLLDPILKHTQCIKMLDNIIDSAMHSKYLHRQKLAEIRPKDSDSNVALAVLVRKYDQSDLVQDAVKQQLANWIKDAKLPGSFISPAFYKDAVQIQQWVASMIVPTNVVDVDTTGDTPEEAQLEEDTLCREISRNALRDFFGDNRRLNIYLALYNEAHGTNIDKVERRY